MALAMLYAAVRLPTGERVRRFAIGLLALHFVFGVVKVVGYDEAEAGLFMAFDVALIALLAWGGWRGASGRAAVRSV